MNNLLKILLAIFLPPVCAFLQVGFSLHFLINIVLTLLGGLPLGALLWSLPGWLTSSGLTLLGQWLLYCCLGLWLSAGLWWILSLMNSDPLPKGSGPDKGLL